MYLTISIFVTYLSTIVKMKKVSKFRPRSVANGVHKVDLQRDLVYELLLLDIMCGDLRPGQIIDEAMLAERYRVGRAGVGDAFYRLSLEGLIERRPRLGSVIADISVREL